MNLCITKGIALGLGLFIGSVATLGTSCAQGPLDWLADLDRERLDRMDSSPRAGRDYTRLHIANRTNRTLWAAIHYLPYQDPRGSQLAVLEDPWRSAGWFKLAPGERTYVANSGNRYFYVAVIENNGALWGGNHYIQDPRKNRSVPSSKHDFGGKNLRSFTLNLTN